MVNHLLRIHWDDHITGIITSLGWISSTRILAALQPDEGRLSVPVAIICRSSAAFLALVANCQPQHDGHVEQVLTLRPLWDGRPHFSGTVESSASESGRSNPVGVLQFLVMISWGFGAHSLVVVQGQLDRLATQRMVEDSAPQTQHL